MGTVAFWRVLWTVLLRKCSVKPLTSATGFLERTYYLILRNGQLKYITALTSRMRCISYACSIDNDVLYTYANIREQPFTALSFSLCLFSNFRKKCACIEYTWVLIKTDYFNSWYNWHEKNNYLFFPSCRHKNVKLKKSRRTLLEECSSGNRLMK